MTSEQVWFKDYLCFACDGHLTLSLAMLEMHFGLAYNKLIYQVVLYQTYSGPNMKQSFSKKLLLSKLDYLVSHQIFPKTFKKVKIYNFDNLERTFLILALCSENNVHDPSYDKDMKFTNSFANFQSTKKGFFLKIVKRSVIAFNLKQVTCLNAYRVGNTGAMQYLLGPGFKLIYTKQNV